MSKKAYPCIGGPLDGQYAITDDFYRGYGNEPGGIYAHLGDDYYEFNRAGSFKAPSMIFLHKSLLKPAISPKDR